MSVSADSLIKDFQVMYQEHWKYEWGKHEEGCVDCSGAFTYAFGLHGIKYPNGSNTIARKYIVGEMLPISMAEPGMAAFKGKTPEESDYDLPDKFRPSGQEYNKDVVDYYHIGLVDSDPEYVLNAKGTSYGFCRNKLTSKNGWDYVARLKYVDYGGESKMEIAKVVLPAGASGSTVNMRRVPSRSSDIIVKVPVGAEVTVTEDAGQWCRISYGDKSGYMMSNYLEHTGQSGESDGITPGQREDIDKALTRMEEYAKAILEQIEIVGSIVGRG